MKKKNELDTAEAPLYFPPHHHGTLREQSASKTTATCKRSQEKCSCDLADPLPPISVLKYQGSPVTTASALHAERARHNSDHRKHADPWTSKSIKVTGWEISRPLSEGSAYFLVAPCLCGDSRTGSGGGGTGPSHDPCRHSPASDIDFPSCLRVKHLLERSQTINTWKCIVGTMGPTKCQSSEAQRNTKDVTKMKGSGSIYAIYILFMPTPCVFLLCTY